MSTSMQSTALMEVTPPVMTPLLRRGWVDLGPMSDGWTDVAAQPKMSPRPTSTFSVSVSRPAFRFRRPSDEAMDTAALFATY